MNRIITFARKIFNKPFVSMNNAPITVEQGRTLLVHIEHSKPIEIEDLTKSLTSIGKLYSMYAEKNGISADMAKAKLYVEKIEHGSIDISFVECVAATGLIPFVENCNQLIDFAKHISEFFGYLTMRDRPKPNMSASQLKAFDDFLELTSKDERGQCSVSVVNNGKVEFSGCTINYHQSNDSQNQIRKEVESMQAQVADSVKEKVLMKIFQINANTESRANKAIIDSVCNRKLPITYANEDVKSQILADDINPIKNVYIVDVEVMTVEGQPTVYRILKVHETLPLD